MSLPMKQLFTAAGLALAVLFLFLGLQVKRMLVSQSICNDWGAWGIPIHPSILIGIGIGGIVFVVWKGKALECGRMAVWGVLFLAGGWSNVYERITFGCVSDYIHVFSWFPAFNGADVLLTVAVLGFLWENREVDFYNGHSTF